MSKMVAVNGYPLYDYIMAWFGLLPFGNGFEVWQLITYQFIHGGFLHILFNMFILWMFGIEVENLWGSKRFLTFYLSAGVIGGLFQLILSPILFGNAMWNTIGASGAIMGVMVAFAFLFPNRMIYLYFLIPIKTKYFIIALILFDFFAVNSGDSVAHLVHIGGALTGLAYMLYEKKRGTTYGNYFSGGSSSSIKEDFLGKMRGVSDMFKKKDKKVEDAKFYEVKDGKNEEEEITQKDIDEILDKISQSGYQNLTEREKKILFEASKKMK